jgi:hypothetical protein
MEGFHKKTYEIFKKVYFVGYKEADGKNIGNYTVDDFQKDIKSLLASSQDSFRRKVDELIRARMMKFANTELKKRKNAFDEMAELNKDIAKLKNIK